MTIYQSILADRIVGVNVASSPGTGWTSVADFPTLVSNARSQNLPLTLRAGTFPSSQIDLTTSTGGGNPLVMIAEIGPAIVQLSGSAPYLFKVNNVNNVVIRGVTFDGNNVTLTDTSQTAALVHFSGSSVTHFQFSDCSIANTTQAGISCDSGAKGRITDNQIYNCDSAVFILDSFVYIERNIVTLCKNNGVLVWTSAISGNSSVISDNYIDTITNTNGGTGQYGNGINIFRAYNVRVINNTVFNCNYSAIRLNAAGNCHVANNFCYNLREVAIFVEAPTSGLNLDGGVVANNIVNKAGSGISAVNSGLFSDGVSRRITITGNQIVNLTQNNIPEEGAATYAIGIVAEGSCNVVGNNIESAAVAGIVLGTNSASTDLTASGNFIHSCPIGIGYSANTSAVGTLISSNLISNYVTSTTPGSSTYKHSGAIVSVNFTGTDYVRDSSGSTPNTDYGNAAQTIVGPLTVGMNKAH